MPRVSEMIESKYLRKEDIQDEAVVTIERIGKVNVALDDQPEEKKWAVKFAEFAKPMVLNSTNIQLLAKACGSDNTDDWKQRKVIVYVDDNVSFQGKLIGGLRIRPYRPMPIQPQPQARTVTDLNDLSDSPDGVSPISPRSAPPPARRPDHVPGIDDDIPF